MHGLRGDFKLAARRLAATPLFTAFAVLSLAIGVGVTTAVYSVSSGMPFGTTITPLAYLSTPDRPIVPNGSFQDALLIIVSESSARKMFGTADVVGRASPSAWASASPAAPSLPH